MKQIASALMRALETLLGIALLLIIALNFANVVGRYVFNSSILGAEEVQVYAMIWMAFVGAGIVTWRNMHLRMDALSMRFPAAIRNVLKIVELILCLVVVGYAVTQSWDYVSRMLMLGNSSDVAHIPMWIAHSSVLVGLVLVIIMLVAATLTGGENAPEDTSGEGSRTP